MGLAEDDPASFQVIGAAMAVHSELGPGFLEAVYQEALALELANRSIAHEREVWLPIRYAGVQLSTRYRADFIVANKMVVELKATVSIGRIEEAQVVHYLKATGLATGILLNFGSTSLQVRRLTHRVRLIEPPEIELDGQQAGTAQFPKFP